MLHLLLSNAPSEIALNACATLNLGRVVLKVLETNPGGKPSIENRALATLMFWIAHFEGIGPAILRARGLDDDLFVAGPTSPGRLYRNDGGRFTDAIALFERLVFSTTFEEFLTVSAYELLTA